MVDELANALDEAVEGRGGHAIGVRPGGVRPGGVRFGSERYSGGGRTVVLLAFATGTAQVEIEEFGRTAAREAEVVGFDSVDEARAEYERLKAVLFVREWVEWVLGPLHSAGIVPACFRESILAGDLDALVIAADWQDERDNPNAALLLRAAYHKVRGEANVAVHAGKGVTAVLNPHVVTKRGPAKPEASGPVRAVVVTAGKSVRIVSVVVKCESRSDTSNPGGRVVTTTTCVEERIFRTGDQAEYGSYNLVYFAPIRALTAKTVVIAEDAPVSGTRPTHRLTLAQFVEKNHDFDLAKARKRNSEWMD